METGKTNWMLTVFIATMAFLTQQAHALFTPELGVASNQVAFYFNTLTNSGDAAEARALNNALKTLAKPSTSVAKDYDLFVGAALKLGQFALSDSNLFVIGSNTFAFFLNTADGLIGATAARIGALNDFVKTKKPASNALAQAIATLNLAAANPDLPSALPQGRQVFAKITTANKLAAAGEEHPGFALDRVDETLLTTTSGNATSVAHLQGGGTFTENALTGTYTYERTGLNSGKLILTHDDGSGTPNVTTATLAFKSSNQGKFKTTNTSSEGTGKIAGTFAIEED